jgi:membrane protease YdiL (CAAX protease family)
MNDSDPDWNGDAPFGNGPDEEITLDRNQVMKMTIAVEAGMGAAALGIGYYFDIPFAKSIHLYPPDWFALGIGAISALIAALIAIFIQRLPFSFTKQLKEDSNRVVSNLLGQCTRPDLIGIAMLAGVGEELLFRGLFQQGLMFAVPEDWLAAGPWIVTAIVALLFGMLHSISIPYVVVATIASVGLSVLFITTGDLLACILCHALYDLVLLLVLVKPQEITEEDEE